MTAPNKRSRTYRRSQVRMPGGENKVVYTLRKPKVAKCGNCNAVLHGAPRLRPNDLKKIAKTEKRPERPYGGVLCSSCARQKIKLMVRA